MSDNFFFADNLPAIKRSHHGVRSCSAGCAMFAALLHVYKSTFTSKIPLADYMRATTYLWALLFIAIDVAFGKTGQLLEVFVGQILVCYLLVGTLGEVYVHRKVIADDGAAKARRYEQSLQEIRVAVDVDQHDRKL